MRALLSCFGKFRLFPELSMALAFPLMPLRLNRKTDDAKLLSVLVCPSSSSVLYQFTVSCLCSVP